MFSLLFKHKRVAIGWTCHLPGWKLQLCPDSLLGSSLQYMAKKFKSLFADRGDRDRGKTLYLDHFILFLSLLSSESQRLISVFLLVSRLWMHKKLQHSSLSECLADQARCCMSWLLQKVSYSAYRHANQQPAFELVWSFALPTCNGLEMAGLIPDISQTCLSPCLLYSSLAPWWWHCTQLQLEKPPPKVFILGCNQCTFSQWQD